jgi:imidazolonepropionase-like amidohydrolase
VFGTDSGVSPHGQNGREFEILVQAGLTPLEAIQSATTGGAAHNRLEDETGRIAPGLAADIIAVAQDPTRDIRQLRQVRFVMARGRVAKGG